MIFISEADATTAGSAGPFTDFMTCYEEVIAPLTLEEDSDYAEAAEQFFENGGAEFVEQFESSLDCASICETPLFYLSVSISEGPPTQDCMTPIMENLDQPIAGGVALFTGIICLMAFCASFGLCCGFSGKKDMMDKDDA